MREEQEEENDEPAVHYDKHGEMGAKFKEVKKSMKTGKLSRANIIDIVDFIVRRKNIFPTNRAILINFLLNRIPCCSRNCLLRTRKA